MERLPDYWHEKPLKYIASINDDKVPDDADPDYNIEYVDIGNVNLETGITGTEQMRFEAAPSRARRRVKEGDTIVSTVRTYLKAVAYIARPPENLVVSTGFAVLRPNAALDPKYLYRLAQSQAFVECIVAHSVGVSYPAINAADIGNFKVPIPPLTEQRAIAAFLEHETTRIDELIAKKERLIELLMRSRETKASAALTRGLIRNSVVKSTAYPWLGEIPKHWRVMAMKRVLAAIDYGISDSLKEAGQIAVLRMGNLQNGEVDLAELRYTDHVDDSLLLRENDILFNRTNSLALIGKAALFRPSGDNDVSFASYLVRLRTTSEILPAYLCLFLNRPETLDRARALALPAIGQANLNPNRYGYMPICVPPIAEQVAIVEFIEALSLQLRAVAGQVRRAITRLRQYRSAIIAAAVTGQIDLHNYKPETLCQ